MNTRVFTAGDVGDSGDAVSFQRVQPSPVSAARLGTVGTNTSIGSNCPHVPNHGFRVGDVTNTNKTGAVPTVPSVPNQNRQLLSGFLARWASDVPPQGTARQPIATGNTAEGTPASSRELRPQAACDQVAEVRHSSAPEGSIVGRPKRSSVPDAADDACGAEARHEVLDLMFIAYQRYARVARITVEHPTDAVKKDLALCADQSVHGHGQHI